MEGVGADGEGFGCTGFMNKVGYGGEGDWLMSSAAWKLPSHHQHRCHRYQYRPTPCAESP